MRVAGWGAFPAKCAQALHRFVRWWVNELVELVPFAWRAGNRYRIEAHVVDDIIVVKIHRPPAAVIEGRLDVAQRTAAPPDFASRLAREYRSLPVWIIPPPQAILSRLVQVPRSAAGRFDQLLAVEADRWTPFSAQEIVAAWRVKDHDERRNEVELRFLPRALVDRWTTVLASFGLTASSVVLGQEHAFRAAIGGRNVSFAQGYGRNVGISLLVLGAAFLALVDWAATVRERDAWQARVSSERRLLAQQAELESRIESLHASQSAPQPPQAALLGLLSSALPPGDWLTEISVREGTAILRGYSAGVDALLKALEPLAVDAVVTIQGELAFDARLQRQRFTVTLRVGESGR